MDHTRNTQEVVGVEDKTEDDRNNYEIVLAPGYRYASVRPGEWNWILTILNLFYSRISSAYIVH